MMHARYFFLFNYCFDFCLLFDFLGCLFFVFVVCAVVFKRLFGGFVWGLAFCSLIVMHVLGGV